MIARARASSASSGAKIAFATATCAGVDQRLAVEAEIAALLAFGQEAGLVLEVVIDAVEDVDAMGAGRQQGRWSARAASAPGLARSGRASPWRGRWCPSRSRRAASRRSLRGAGDALDIEDGERRLDHRPDPDRRASAHSPSSSVADLLQVSGAETFGIRIASGFASAAAARSSSNQGVSTPVDADHDLAPAIAARLDRCADLRARRLPWRRERPRPRDRGSAHRLRSRGPFRAHAHSSPAYRGRCGGGGSSVMSLSPEVALRCTAHQTHADAMPTRPKVPGRAEQCA